jgi:putative FmdB family regulatory protein
VLTTGAKPVPTYQYTCTECGEPLEAVQSFSDPALTTCPACGGRLRKVFSAVGVVFKGSGFYRTDSRAGAAKSDSGAKADSGSGSGSKGSSEAATSGSNGSSGSGSSSDSTSSSESKRSSAPSGSTGSSSGSSTSAAAAP